MKKCPKCKAELQEEARFCLYCMTSFEEKQTIETPKESNKRWLYIIATVLVLVILISCFFIFKPKDKESAAKNSTVLSSSINSILTSSDNGGTASSQPQSDVSDSDKASVPANSSQSQPSSTDTDSTSNDSSSNTTTSTTTTSNTSSTSSENTVTSSSTGNTVSNSSQSSTSTVSSESANSSVSSDSTVSHVTSSVPDWEPKYTYIEATVENTYPNASVAMYAPENAIVITKVNYKEESGVYVIPDTVDGKKVAAIMPSAFRDPSISSSVKSVTLPSTVRTIWNDAFEGCFNLTDLYLKTTVVEIFEDSFPETSQRNGRLTIHCKKDCRNFNFYYYRNIASRYGADYEEWNG